MSISGILKVFGIIFLVPFVLFIFMNVDNIIWCLISHIGLIIPESISDLLYQLIPKSFIEFLSVAPTTSELLSILGIFATVSVTFLTLLFAIAAINASFRAGKSNKVDSGAYPLKLLIKVDLQSTAIRTIIPQLIISVLVLVSHEGYSGMFWMCVFVVLLYLLISTLWNTTNSVYYSIIQYNSDDQLCKSLKQIDNTGSVSRLKSYIPKRYDVYSVKKTLYPKIHKKIHKSLRKNKHLKDSKEELVDEWNNKFMNILNNTLDNINKKYGNKTLVSAINLEGDRRNFGILKILTPKVQAPDKVVKICLDLLKEAPISNELDSIPYDRNTVCYCLLLLAAHKLYAESRQDERNKHNVRINRDRYTNPDDTHMYMLYGYLLYLLGEYERKKTNNKGINEYDKEVLKSYKCAVIANPNNKVAEENLKIIATYLDSLQSK